MNGMPRQLTISALVVACLLTVAAMGAHTREDVRRGASVSAPAPGAILERETAAAAEASSRPLPTAHETVVRAIPPISASAAPRLATPLDESALMLELRQMRQSDPELSLWLAREGNQRFPSSPDAAERASIVVKSLMRMGRADEAMAEARTMIEQYPGTPWALDVKRHMLDVPSYVAH
jgi:hypothetical protein